MKPFSLVVKPAGGGCNLRCSYCFYRDGHPAGAMPRALAEKAFAEYAALPFGGKSVTLQGGEPMLAFRSGVFEALDAAPGVAKSVQTNATLVTGEAAEFFARGGWLVGASLDGPEPLNRLRGESFADAVRGIRRLERAGAEYNILSVVSSANAAHPAEVYRFFRENFSTRFYQFTECTGPRDAVCAEEWGAFLVGLFDEWIRNDARTVSVRLFDSIVSQLVLGSPTLCPQRASCGGHLVLEHDGSVYPCDFFVSPATRLGILAETTLAEIAQSRAFAAFASAKTAIVPEKCRHCEFFRFCRGDCPRSRRSLCAGWRMFFAHALPRLSELAEDVRRSR